MQHFIGVVPPIATSDRLRAEFRYGSEPHITVKAQSGLTGERAVALLPTLRTSLQAFGMFEVALAGLGRFGERVAYLSVQSTRIHELNKLLVELVNPAPDERLRYHELEPYTPHLTIARGRNLNIIELGKSVEKLMPLPMFSVESIWLFRQDEAGKPYRRAAEIRLG